MPALAVRGRVGRARRTKRESSWGTRLFGPLTVPRDCRLLRTPRKMTRVVRAPARGTPLRPARAPAAASGSVASGSMSKRKGGGHLENALAKFQCVPLRPPRLRSGGPATWSSARSAASGVTLPARRRADPLDAACPPTPPILTGTYRKVRQQSAKISIDASKDRARLDARSNAQAERLKAAAEAEARERFQLRASRGSGVSTPSAANLAATNWLMKQKRVMDLLHRTRKPMSTAELHNERGMRGGRAGALGDLTHNDKVRLTKKRGGASNKAKHSLRDRREMLALIHKHPDGVLEAPRRGRVPRRGGGCRRARREQRRSSWSTPSRAARAVPDVADAYEVHVDEDVSAAFHGARSPRTTPIGTRRCGRSGSSPRPAARTPRAAATTTTKATTPGKRKKKEHAR